MESLFKPGAKVNPEHKGKYIYLLAYASTVAEVWKRVSRLIIVHLRYFPLSWFVNYLMPIFYLN